MASEKLQIVPLGGLGEFGMNCLALRYEDDIIVIDAGLMFPEEELLGVELHPFGGGHPKAGPVAPIGVNGYLWRASLDTLAFLPMQSADPFGGVIISEWYIAPGAPDERLKVTVYIMDR